MDIPAPEMLMHIGEGASTTSGWGSRFATVMICDMVLAIRFARDFREGVPRWYPDLAGVDGEGRGSLSTLATYAAWKVRNSSLST